MKNIFIVVFILCSIQAKSQELDIGYSIEPLWSILGKIPYPYSNCLFIEYSPPKAEFSILSGVTYYINQPGIVVPVVFSPNFSGSRRISVSPEFGASPLIYFNKNIYGKRMDLILQGSLQIEMRTKGRFEPFTSIGIQYFPSYYEVPNKWGGDDIYRLEQKIIPYFSIGIKYQLRDPYQPFDAN